MTAYIEDTSYLKIEIYSGHPRGKVIADVMVDYVASNKQFLNVRTQSVMAARKIISSLGMREDNLFRFGIRKEYFSGKTRKQVWLATKTLELCKAMRELEWVRLIKDLNSNGSFAPLQ